MFYEAIREQAEAAPRAALPAVTAALWKAFTAGQVTEAEAEALSVLIETRQASSSVQNTGQSPNPTGTADGSKAPSDRPGSRRTGRSGSRPRTDASMERRRRWTASGRLPPGLACRFTLAEQAVLALIAAETVRRKDCRLTVGNIAAIAGVSETTVRNAVREARKLGLLTVEERRLTGFRNDTNILRIVSAEWLGWLRLARKGVHRADILGGDLLPSQGRGHHDPALREGGGCKLPKGTPTQVLDLRKPRPAEPKKGCRKAAVGFNDATSGEFSRPARGGRAMRR